MRLASVVVLGAALLLADTAHSAACYGTGGRRLAEVGDYRTYRDQDNVLSTSVVTSESYDPILDVQEVTAQTVGGSSDGQLSFNRNAAQQSLYEGNDRPVLGQSGLVTLSTRFYPPIPTSYPICPEATQSFEGSVFLTASGFTPCTGSYQSTLVGSQWEYVTTQLGTFLALRVSTELDLQITPTAGCDLAPVQDVDTAWLAPGAGAVRIQSGDTVRDLVDAKPAPVPETEELPSALVAAASICALVLRRAKSSQSRQLARASLPRS